MATPPNHERQDAPTGRSDRSLNWGWIALGGCFGLLLLLFPFIAVLLGMIIGAWQEERESDRRHAQATAEAAAAVCLEVPSGVLARIEDALRLPGYRLRGARAVRPPQYPWLWVIAADVERVDLEGDDFEGDDDFAVWHLETKNFEDASPTPDASITAVTFTAARVSTFAYDSSADTFVEPGLRCTAAALSGT
jgi:hypothetical protein